MFEIREEDIDGVKEWLWPKSDDGLWTGPMEDWRLRHKHQIMRYSKNFRTVVQAGGGCGMYPRLLSNIFATVYTFEPHPDSFHCLVHNCHRPNITKLNAAVGSHAALVSIKPGNDHNLGTHKIEERGNSSIPMLPIDAIAFRECDLIMLDIEGYEIEALKGAYQTIHKFKPVIFVERGHNCEAYLKELNYEQVGVAAQDTIFSFKEN